jgi:hypothetical protein
VSLRPELERNFPGLVETILKCAGNRPAQKPSQSSASEEPAPDKTS